jgi:hypothetical protein
VTTQKPASVTSPILFELIYGMMPAPLQSTDIVLQFRGALLSDCTKSVQGYEIAGFCGTKFFSDEFRVELPPLRWSAITKHRIHGRSDGISVLNDRHYRPVPASISGISMRLDHPTMDHRLRWSFSPTAWVWPCLLMWYSLVPLPERRSK